jgi:hypothetical protein
MKISSGLINFNWKDYSTYPVYMYWISVGINLKNSLYTNLLQSLTEQWTPFVSGAKNFINRSLILYTFSRIFYYLIENLKSQARKQNLQKRLYC